MDRSEPSDAERLTCLDSLSERGFVELALRAATRAAEEAEPGPIRDELAAFCQRLAGLLEEESDDI